MGMSYQDVTSLSPGDKITLDLQALWMDEFDYALDEKCELSYEGYIIATPDDSEMGDEYPYIDLCTNAGVVACDGETCEVIEVNPDAEYIELRSEDYDANFRMGISDAMYANMI